MAQSSLCVKYDDYIVIDAWVPTEKAPLGTSQSSRNVVLLYPIVYMG